MKKIIINKYILQILAGCFILCGSCDDFLDVAPTAELESVYFENENRVDRGIGAIYSEVGVLYCPNMESGQFAGVGPLHRLWTLPGDDMTTSNTINSEFEAFLAMTPGNGFVSSYWGILYAIVARSNFMLEQLADPKVLDVIITPNHANYCKGEALFLRSWANVKLWDSFRKAPNQKERIKDMSNSLLPPTKGFELLDQAISDLQSAVELLPDSWNANNKGRVFKNSARGLLVKCYVMRACYSSQYEGGNQTGDYEKAISIFETIDANSTITGVSFGNNFDYRTENNPESLFEYQASHNIKEDNPWLNGNFGGDAGAMGVIYIQYFNHNHTNYMCGSLYGPTRKLINSFNANDPRRAETFRRANTTDPNYPWLEAISYFGGYQFVKYINGARRGDLDRSYGVTSINNPRLLRLADVKLAAAEAYLQLNNETAARKQVNDIRFRARNSISPVSDEPADFTAPITMQSIMDERFMELAGEEDFRFSDMKRWHAAGYINLEEWAAQALNMWGYDANTIGNPFMFDINKNLLLPIPTSEINTNPRMQEDGNNPGYN